MPDDLPRRPLGITVLGDFIVAEGPEAIVENLLRAGATDVACNPTVTVAAAEGEGSFQPPSDAGQSPRLFDRPLYGKRALWVKSGPSYQPRADYYQATKYGPRRTNEVTELHGAAIGRFVEACRSNNISVLFQLGAVQPTGLADEDRPRLPDGSLPAGRMADTGSLASEAIRDYNRAYVRDLLAEYPGISGFRVDWPEYPCYTFGEVFQDFSPHVEQFASRRGFDFAAISRDVERLISFLRGSLSNAYLVDLAGPERGRFVEHVLLEHCHAVGEWLRLKAALSVDTLRAWREAINSAGGAEVQLVANAFMPPFTLLTGFDFASAAEFCTAISPKLYTMHWALMVTFWGRALLDANAGLDEQLVARALVNLIDLADDNTHVTSLADYAYPKPDQPHPIADAPQLRKIRQAALATGGRAALVPLVHGYGPFDDFCRRLRLVAVCPQADGVWINRYGYLSDEKLDEIGRIWR